MTSLVRWEPFGDLITLRTAMDRLFDESLVRTRRGEIDPVGTARLAVDMFETDEAVVVKTAIPGINPEDIDISVVGDRVTIKGETRFEEAVEKENYIRRERRYGAFARSLTTPVAVIADEAEAEFENGVLTLTLPKAEEVKPKAIEVKSK